MATVSFSGARRLRSKMAAMVSPLLGEKPKILIKSNTYYTPSITTRARSLARFVYSTTQDFDTDFADTRRLFPRYLGVPLRQSGSQMGLKISKSPRVRVVRLFLFRSCPTVRRTRTGCVPPASARVHAQTPACATTWVDTLHTGTRPAQDAR